MKRRRILELEIEIKSISKKFHENCKYTEETAEESALLLYVLFSNVLRTFNVQIT